ncbi:MAG: hypothetical protein ACR2QS_16255 [Woeseiaceae bacterium]
MKKPDIQTLAAWSEILASIAVIVSLIFVIISLNQNTAALRAMNDNLLYQIQDARFSDANNDAELAEIALKRFKGEPISEIEDQRLFYWVVREVNLWELAYVRHSEGLMSPLQWETWDRNSVSNVLDTLPKKDWDQYLRQGYNPGFVEHVDAIYAEHKDAN